MVRSKADISASIWETVLATLFAPWRIDSHSARITMRCSLKKVGLRVQRGGKRAAVAVAAVGRAGQLLVARLVRGLVRGRGAPDLHGKLLELHVQAVHRALVVRVEGLERRGRLAHPRRLE